jgi:uncharacterized repeat protein (TIGR01451 family)
MSTQRFATTWWLTFAAIYAVGCTSLRLPALDPSGERIFLPAPAYTTLNTPFGGPGNYGVPPPPLFERPPPLPAPGTYGPLIPYNNSELTYNPLQAPSYPAPYFGGPPGAPIAVPPNSIPPISPGVGPPIAAPQQPLPPPGLAGAYPPGQGALTDGYAGKLSINPTRLIAPVGQEVVLQAGLCGADGYLITCQNIEWSISPDSVGTIVEVDQFDKPLWRQVLRKSPRKFSGQYAVGRTSESDQVIPRGLPGPQDDIFLAEGQTWITVTSASEGATHITAVAPTAAGWEERRQNSSIYWVDGQWLFPPPAVGGPAGGLLQTRVNRATNGSPIEGWRVRYEIVGGTPASLDPNGAQVLEVPTNSEGIAAVQITPQGAATGLTTIKVQVIRAGSNPGDLDRLVVGENSTSVTWTDAGSAPPPVSPSFPANPLPPSDSVVTPPSGSNLAVDINGPPNATANQTITYQIVVTNRGSSVLDSVEVSNDSSPALEFIRSEPAGNLFGTILRWELPQLSPGESRTILAEYRLLRSEPVRNCVRALSGSNTAEDCADTQVQANALQINIRGPETATVGDQLPYEIIVTNTSSQPVQGVVVRSTFPPGLSSVFGPGPLESPPIPSLAPGASQTTPIRFTAVQAGTQCHQVDAWSADGSRAQSQICVNVAAGASTPPVIGTTPPPIRVVLIAPAVTQVNQQVLFRAEVMNQGSAPLSGVEVTYRGTQEIVPQRATENHRGDGTELTWTIPSLAPGQPMLYEVNGLTVREAIQACVSFEVRSAEGATGQDQRCVRIDPAEPAGAVGPPSPGTTLGEGLAVRILRAPASGDGLIRYDVDIANRDPQEHSEVVLTIRTPEGTQYERASGPPTIQALFKPDSRTVDFSPIRTLRSGEQVSFQIFVRPSEASVGRFEAKVSSRETPEPVTALE